MQASVTSRAVAAAMAVAVSQGLAADDAAVLWNSNKLALRLLPCDAFARVAPEAEQVARFEVDLAQRLAASGSPVAALDPRVDPRPYERDGFVVTLWTYYEPVADEVSPAGYADALHRLHAGLRPIDLPAPRFTDRAADAQRLVASPELTPELPGADREFLAGALRELRQAAAGSGAADQLLHGEPHPGNVLATKDGPLFVDLETCCRGPVEFDLAHAPDEVAGHYPDADHDLLRTLRLLTLAMISTWRWDRGDHFPNGRQLGIDWLTELRQAMPGNHQA